MTKAWVPWILWVACLGAVLWLGVELHCSATFWTNAGKLLIAAAVGCYFYTRKDHPDGRKVPKVTGTVPTVNPEAFPPGGLRQQDWPPPVSIAPWNGLRLALAQQSANLFRIMNLVWASFFVLLIIWPDDWRMCFSPEPAPPAPLTLRLLMEDTMIWLWFAAAWALFFRSRLAWLVSLIGTGWAIWIYATLLYESAELYLNPNEKLKQQMVSIPDACMMAMITWLGFSIVLLTLTAGLLLGLVKMRKEVKWL